MLSLVNYMLTAVLEQNGSEKNVTDKMVRTKWYG